MYHGKENTFFKQRTDVNTDPDAAIPISGNIPSFSWA